ncbi:N-acetyltransferase [Mesobaculum littorinae]|uniref:N-acetyltransferase n=1 Tax=Mesobaculum littorinae TaxID=2486419 RepID=A0A438AGJ8_9RHOB|nr:N-acetyltransferase [Mesobaculum littorinae]RVV97832.1 N-acetyltransferase [Mesobaculum littorinae]
MAELTIREIGREEEETVWRLLKPIVEAGETLCAPPGGGRAGGLAYWWPATARVFLAEAEGTPLGTAYLRPNQTGGGAHVCNAGFATAPEAKGRGVARALLVRVLDEARAAGFAAMQFNFVVASNTRAIAIWESHGFEVVGRLPCAYRPLSGGEVDALVMYRRLDDTPPPHDT